MFFLMMLNLPFNLEMIFIYGETLAPTFFCLAFEYLLKKFCARKTKTWAVSGDRDIFCQQLKLLSSFPAVKIKWVSVTA